MSSNEERIEMQTAARMAGIFNGASNVTMMNDEQLGESVGSYLVILVKDLLEDIESGDVPPEMAAGLLNGWSAEKFQTAVVVFPELLSHIVQQFVSGVGNAESALNTAKRLQLEALNGPDNLHEKAKRIIEDAMKEIDDKFKKGEALTDDPFKRRFEREPWGAAITDAAEEVDKRMKICATLIVTAFRKSVDMWMGLEHQLADLYNDITGKLDEEEGGE